MHLLKIWFIEDAFLPILVLYTLSNLLPYLIYYWLYVTSNFRSVHIRLLQEQQVLHSSSIKGDWMAEQTNLCSQALLEILLAL